MTHPNAEILRAIADGKKVQWRNVAGLPGRWFDLCKAKLSLTVFERLTMALVVGETHLEWRVKPEKKTGWINIYPTGAGAKVLETKEKASEHRLPGVIACIQITYEEGEGL